MESGEFQDIDEVIFRALESQDAEDFTEEHPETLRIHTIKNRKDAYR